MLKFEEDPQLQDLLDDQQRLRITRALSALVGSTVRLEPSYSEGAIPVEFNLETMGWLSSDEATTDLRAAGDLVSFVLMFVAKYRLAANLHNDATVANYAELQRQNEALKASEARYRELSEQLQVRVDEQVETIRQAEQELFESARLRSVGHLAAGVAHEINNPIGFISSNLRVASDYVGELAAPGVDPSEKQELLADFQDLIAESADGARRIATIVADLKTFSSIDQAEYTVCNLNELIRSGIHLTQTEYGRDLGIVEKLSGEAALSGHPARLSQAFFNLIANAAKAIEDNHSASKPGRILVKSEVTDTEIRVVVQDNGCGIPEELQGQVFDAFFTTRAVGSGTGLGLTVVKDTVRAHNGHIQLDSREGIGTRVTLRFPVN